MLQLQKPTWLALDGYQGSDVDASWRVQRSTDLLITRESASLAPLPPMPNPLKDLAGDFGGLTSPAGVCVSDDGTVFVADSATDTIYKIRCHEGQPVGARFYSVSKDPYSRDRFVYVPAATRVERWPGTIRGVPTSADQIELICDTVWTESMVRPLVIAYIGGADTDVTNEWTDNYPVGLPAGSVCQKTLSWLPCIGGSGWRPGRFHHPRGLAISPNRELLVADTGNHRIQVFLDAGKAIGEIWGKTAGLDDVVTPVPGPDCLPGHDQAIHFGQPIAGNLPGEFSSPSDVALAKDGSVLIADSGNHRVQKRSRETGQFSAFDGTPLAAHVFRVRYGPQVNDRYVYIPFAGRLEIWPASLTRDPRDPSETIVVSTSVNSVAAAAALTLQRVGATGSRDILQEMDITYPQVLASGVPFSSPSRLAVDNVGRIYVVDDNRDSVAMLDSAGRLLADITDAGDAAGRFRPVDVSMDDNGKLTIATCSALHRFSVNSDACVHDGCYARLIEPCVALDCTQKSAVLCSAPPASPVTVVPASTGFAQKGTYISSALDSRIDRCKWDKIVIDFAGPIPTGCKVTVSTFTSEALMDASALASLTDKDWDTNQTNASEFLILSGRARYLWMRIVLTGDGKSTAVINRVKVFFPRIGYLQYLPAIYQADPVSADFLDRFLASFEATLSGLENRIDHFADLFTAYGVPANFLSWLAGWIDLVFQPGWTEQTRRLLLQNAPALYRQRGTPGGLKLFLRLALGIEVQILEWFQLRRWLFLNQSSVPLGRSSPLWGNCIVRRLQLDENSRIGDFLLVGTNDPERDPFFVDAYKFSVLVPASVAESSTTQSMLRLLIEQEKPAYTQYDLLPVEAQFRLGVQSTIGFDTVVGAYPRVVLGKCSTLGFDTLLGCACDEERTSLPVRLSPGIRLAA